MSHPEQHDEVQADAGEMDVKNVNTSGARNSPVWQFYSEIGSNRVKCNKCETVLKYYVSKMFLSLAKILVSQISPRDS